MSKTTQILVFILLLQVTPIFSPSFTGDQKDDKVPNYSDYDDDDFTMMVAGGYRPLKGTYSKYMVSIRTKKSRAYFGDNHFCAGTIIASRLILTAAHCIMDSNKSVTRPRRLLVVAGTPSRLEKASTTVEMNVEAVIPHEKYVRKGRNDIAVLRLVSPVPDNNDGIRIIPLIHRKAKPGTICTVVGWGQLFNNGPYASGVVYVDITIADSKLCEQNYPGFTEGMICTTGANDTEKDSCRGDSGGPMICNKQLTGIVSGGIRCGSKSLLGAYTDVFYHRHWIEMVNGGNKGTGSLVLLLCVIFIMI